MDIVSMILTFHLAGAAVFGLLMVAIAGVFVTNKTNYDRKLSIAVAGLTAVQIASGVALSVIVSDGLVSICSKAAIYLAVAGVAEYLLIHRQHQLARTAIVQG
jgi:hypothetical protein